MQVACVSKLDFLGSVQYTWAQQLRQQHLN